MKVQKYELANAIGKLKNVVPSKTTIPVLQNLLVKDGYLTANNTNMSVRVKVPGLEGTFLIPQKAFDVINSMPIGEIEIIPSREEISLKIGTIKSTFNTQRAEEFPLQAVVSTGNESTVKADMLTSSISKVIWAIGKENSAQEMMGCLYMKAENGLLNFVCLDGHVIAWDQQVYDGEFEVLIPRSAAMKLMSVDLEGDVRIVKCDNAVSFLSDTVEVTTRIVSGKYYDFQKMYIDMPYKSEVYRKHIVNAITRVKCCMSADDKRPVRIRMNPGMMSLTYIGSGANIHEVLESSGSEDMSIEIGFNPVLLQEALKVFDSEFIDIHVTNPKYPAIITCDSENLKACVLPVAL